MRRTAKLAGLALASALLATSAYAQPAAEDSQLEDVFASSFGMPSLVPPDNLAAGALGIGPDDITAIRNLSGLQSTLLSGIGRDGSLKGALGIGFSPFAFGARIDVDEYRANLVQRWIARSRFSAALSQAETEDADGAMAVGVQTVLFDRGDAIMRPLKGAAGTPAAQACTTANIPDEDVPGPVTVQTNSDVFKGLIDAFGRCLADQEKATWNDASLAIGLVSVSRAGQNKVTDVSSTNTVAYLSATYGFEGFDSADQLRLINKQLTSDCARGWSLSCNAQITLQAKYESDAAYEVEGVGPASGEAFSYGVKLAGGSPSAVLYAFYRQEEVEFTFGGREVHEYGAGLETKISKSIWVKLSAARKDDEIGGEDSSVKAGLSFDFSQAASLANRFSGD